MKDKISEEKLYPIDIKKYNFGIKNLIFNQVLFQSKDIIKMITKIQSYFIDYPAEAKVWIFMSERELSLQEKEVIKLQLSKFIPEWQAHGEALKADFEIIRNQFIVITVDQTPALATGCSIDSMTRVVKSLEKSLNINLTDRMLVSYLLDGSVKTTALNAFKENVKKGILDENTILFNNSVANLGDFWDNWMQPIKNSWAAPILPS